MVTNNGGVGQLMQGYGTAGSYPQSYHNQENFGIYGQTTYNPQENGDSQGQERVLALLRCYEKAIHNLH